MKNILDKLENRIDDYNIKKKFYCLYIACILLPLVITDSKKHYLWKPCFFKIFIPARTIIPANPGKFPSINYSVIITVHCNFYYPMDIFICCNGKIVLSNGKYASTGKAFEEEGILNLYLFCHFIVT